MKNEDFQKEQRLKAQIILALTMLKFSIVIYEPKSPHLDTIDKYEKEFLETNDIVKLKEDIDKFLEIVKLEFEKFKEDYENGKSN